MVLGVVRMRMFFSYWWGCMVCYRLRPILVGCVLVFVEVDVDVFGCGGVWVICWILGLVPWLGVWFGLASLCGWLG